MSYAYLDIALTYSGLTNQLYNLVCGIIKCIQEKKSMIIIGPFLMQINTTNYCPLSKIIRFPIFAYFLKKRFNLTLVDVYSLKMNKFFRKKRMIVNKWDYVVTPLFDIILKQIQFAPRLVLPALQYVMKTRKQTTDNIINIIHLRIEPDAIAHWSVINKMAEDVFLQRLTETYVSFIQKHIQKEQMTVILSSSHDNGVIQFLKKNGYQFSYLQKLTNQNREINAILDMVVGKQCNGIFIGCGGSTFSDLLGKLMPSDTKKYFLNINNLY